MLYIQNLFANNVKFLSCPILLKNINDFTSVLFTQVLMILYQERFLTIDSDFENFEYRAEFTLFEKEGVTFKKSQETIRQYYHTVDDMVKLSGLEMVQSDDVNLYDFDEADKVFLVLRKV